MADHMGQVHNEVEQFIPLENRIPMKISKRAATSSIQPWRFPDIPERYDPKTRTVAEKKMPSLVMDGFEVKMDIVVEPESKVILPAGLDLARYASQQANCQICRTEPVPLEQLITHLLAEHSISIDFLKPDEVVENLCSIKYIKLSNVSTSAEDTIVEMEKETPEDKLKNSTNDAADISNNKSTELYDKVGDEEHTIFSPAASPNTFDLLTKEKVGQMKYDSTDTAWKENIEPFGQK